MARTIGSGDELEAVITFRASATLRERLRERGKVAGGMGVFIRATLENAIEVKGEDLTLEELMALERRLFNARKQMARSGAYGRKSKHSMVMRAASGGDPTRSELSAMKQSFEAGEAVAQAMAPRIQALSDKLLGHLGAPELPEGGAPEPRAPPNLRTKRKRYASQARSRTQSSRRQARRGTKNQRS